MLGIALSLHLSAVPAVPAAVTELRVATIASERVVHVRAVLVPWLKEVEAATGGRLRMRLFAGGMLGRDPAQQHWLVRTGVADIAWFTL
ncbi:MAG: C4-dicarboxylate ABC transporter substrate-binding protein, partial [Alphaproteobacteria bacterium]